MIGLCRFEVLFSRAVSYQSMMYFILLRVLIVLFQQVSEKLVVVCAQSTVSSTASIAEFSRGVLLLLFFASQVVWSSLQNCQSLVSSAVCRFSTRKE